MTDTQRLPPIQTRKNVAMTTVILDLAFSARFLTRGWVSRYVVMKPGRGNTGSTGSTGSTNPLHLIVQGPPTLSSRLPRGRIRSHLVREARGLGRLHLSGSTEPPAPKPAHRGRLSKSPRRPGLLLASATESSKAALSSRSEASVPSESGGTRGRWLPKPGLLGRAKGSKWARTTAEGSKSGRGLAELSDARWARPAGAKPRPSRLLRDLTEWAVAHASRSGGGP